jgi:hypothetical protein
VVLGFELRVLLDNEKFSREKKKMGREAKKMREQKCLFPSL